MTYGSFSVLVDLAAGGLLLAPHHVLDSVPGRANDDDPIRTLGRGDRAGEQRPPPDHEHGLVGAR